MSTDPFEALGLSARPDLTDEQVRAAWRQVAAETHPDRADGGDLTRYTAASAAYAELRTPWAAAKPSPTWPSGPVLTASRSPRRCQPSSMSRLRQARHGPRSSAWLSSRPGSAAAARCAC
jgi:hypothetical protein